MRHTLLVLHVKIAMGRSCDRVTALSFVGGCHRTRWTRSLFDQFYFRGCRVDRVEVAGRREGKSIRSCAGKFQDAFGLRPFRATNRLSSAVMCASTRPAREFPRATGCGGGLTAAGRGDRGNSLEAGVSVTAEDSGGWFSMAGGLCFEQPMKAATSNPRQNRLFITRSTIRKCVVGINSKAVIHCLGVPIGEVHVSPLVMPHGKIVRIRHPPTIVHHALIIYWRRVSQLGRRTSSASTILAADLRT